MTLTISINPIHQPYSTQHFWFYIYSRGGGGGDGGGGGGQLVRFPASHSVGRGA